MTLNYRLGFTTNRIGRDIRLNRHQGYTERRVPLISLPVFSKFSQTQPKITQACSWDTFPPYVCLSFKYCTSFQNIEKQIRDTLLEEFALHRIKSQEHIQIYKLTSIFIYEHISKHM